MVTKRSSVAAAASPIVIAVLLWSVGSATRGLEAMSRLMVLSAGLILVGIAFSTLILVRSKTARDRLLSLAGVIGNLGLAVIALMQSRSS
jgi:hypothetical protein